MTPDFQNFETSLAAFTALFPCKTTKPEKLADLWLVLTSEERQRVTKGVAGYAVHCRRCRVRPMDPAKFVLTPDLWGAYARDTSVMA